jgi:hypothetical protein
MLATVCHADQYQRARETMASYLAAQRHWQDNLAELIIKERQEFSVIAAAQRDHQHALIELKRARFDYLLKHHPERLNKGELGRFSNFTWTESDSQAAKAVDPAYLVREQDVTRTRSINDGQPNWDDFRKYFQTEFAQSEAFKEEMGLFMEELDKIRQEAEMK